MSRRAYRGDGALQAAVLEKERGNGRAAKATSKGQITIPKPVREALGLTAGDTVLFRVVDRRALVARTPSLLELAGSIPAPADVRGLPWGEVRERMRRSRADRLS
ncbi:MAG TPA: AbrB/MazE/SpoVT family DNA-binding domain-containing protein [Gaiellaceae bacterium]|nr:AbrB/MazE/SpoVT family DNA-binding domain-containing protein [Gaiellaceae bacterium]